MKVLGERILLKMINYRIYLNNLDFEYNHLNTGRLYLCYTPLYGKIK